MSSKGETVPSGSERILLVDDEIALIKMTKQRLEKLGYQVKGVADPIAALKLLHAEPDAFDVVITDMVMPEMNGAQLAEEILKERPDLPVILCTGYSTISAKEALKIGICKYILKPVDFEHLACCIREAIDNKR